MLMAVLTRATVAALLAVTCLPAHALSAPSEVGAPAEAVVEHYVPVDGAEGHLVRKSWDADGDARVHVIDRNGVERTLDDWRRWRAVTAPVVGPDLRDALAGSPDPTRQIPVLILHRSQPFDAVAAAVRSEYANELRQVQGRLQREVAAAVGGDRPVLSDEDEVGLAPVQGPRTAAHADLVSEIEALQGDIRAEIAYRLEAATAGQLDLLTSTVILLGGEVTNRIPMLNAIVARATPAVLEALSMQPEIARIELDGLVHSGLATSNLAMGSPTWWGAGHTGGAFDIAIADSGVDSTHPAFSSHDVVHGVHLSTAGNPAQDNTWDDVNGHGSHVAGISVSDDATYRGVAYAIDKLFNVKAGFDADGNDGGGASMYHSDGMRGVDWAITYGGDSADVVNLSYGGSTTSDDSSYIRFFDGVVSGMNVGTTISAGNSGPGAETCGRPGIAPNVLCVANLYDRGTAARGDDTITSSSSRGPTPGGRRKPDIAAPGTSITACNNTWESGSDFVTMTGTSMAAPQVAGALALLADGGVIDALDQKALLLNTAEDFGTAGWDASFGWGYIDLDRAYQHRADVFSDSVAAQPDFKLYAGPALAGDTATLVWNRRVTYNDQYYPSQYYGLTDLDLYLFDDAGGSQLDSDLTVIDNVQQVTAGSSGNVVVKVDCASGSILGRADEPFALATEENFAVVDPTRLEVEIGVPPYTPPSSVFEVSADVSNDSGASMHGISVTLNLPVGFSLQSGSASQAVGTVATGTGAEVTWQVVAPAGSGSHGFSVDLTSNSYGEAFADSDGGSVTLAGSGTDGIGIHFAPGKAFFLKNSPSSGHADLAFRFGSTTMVPLTGDWDGDGVDTIGMYQPSSGAFFLRNANSQGPADVRFRYGGTDRVPIVGDWDGNGTDTIGIYVAATSTFFLRNTNSAGPADIAFNYGPADLVPVIGDWDGDGTDTIGLHHPPTRSFFLRDSNSAGAADHSFRFGPTDATALGGDWNGSGVDTIGTYNPPSREFMLRNTNSAGPADSTFRFGGSGVTPLVGDWDDL